MLKYLIVILFFPLATPTYSITLLSKTLKTSQDPLACFAQCLQNIENLDQKVARDPDSVTNKDIQEQYQRLFVQELLCIIKVLSVLNNPQFLSTDQGKLIFIKLVHDMKALKGTLNITDPSKLGLSQEDIKNLHAVGNTFNQLSANIDGDFIKKFGKK